MIDPAVIMEAYRLFRDRQIAPDEVFVEVLRAEGLEPSVTCPEFRKAYRKLVDKWVAYAWPVMERDGLLVGQRREIRTRLAA